MSFRLGTIFYVFAVLGAALATFGAGGGIVAAGIVFAFWGWRIHGPKPQLGCLQLVAAALLVGILIALLLPAVQSARPAARRNQCANNLKQIALALLMYESAVRTMPPAYIADANGKPTHSWRVLILPYLSQQTLFGKYNFNEPWNGPNNSKLTAQAPDVYRCPGHEDDADQNPLETNYIAIVGPGSVFPGAAGSPIRAISDGTSKTITVIEASGLGVNWMEPRDLTIDEAVELLTTKPRSGHRTIEDGVFTTTYYETSERYVAFVDGHVEWVSPLADEEIARALLTAAGGERLPQESEMMFVEPKSTTVVKWGKVWGLILFLALAVLPAARTWRRGVRAVNASPSERSDVDKNKVGVAADAKGAGDRAI